MSDLCVHEFVDIAWDEFRLTDDHTVLDPGKKRLHGHFILEDKHKKHLCELDSNLSNTGDKSATRYVDQEGYQSVISSLSKRKNTMLEKNLWSHTPDGACTSAFDSDPVKEASNLASDSTILSAHGLKSNNRNSSCGEFCGLDTILDDKTSIAYSNSFSYPMGDINHAGNDINYFENAENKDSIDLLYCDWPEIENFEDIDRMFRNCDTTFGLGVRREDELNWLSSDDTGGSGGVLRPGVKFHYLESRELENISQSRDCSNSYSIDDSAVISEPIRYKDGSWTPEKSHSYRSSVIGPDIADSQDVLIPDEQIAVSILNNSQPSLSTSSQSRSDSVTVSNEHKNRIKQEIQFEGKSKKHYPGNYRLPNDFEKPSSGLTSHQTPQSIYIQHNQHQLVPDSYNYSQGPISYMHSDSSHFSDPSSVNPKVSLVKSETNELTSISPRDSSHASIQLQYKEGSSDPGSEATALPMCEQRRKPHSHQELGSLNEQESSIMGKHLDDISLEAAAFCQLQIVMEQLDSRTKLCIRDSLYRLAQSAEKRHNLANLNDGCGGEGDDETKRYTSFMDMETDTNPIDRSVAQLLFHRTSDSSAKLAQDSLSFKSSRAVIGSTTSSPHLAENLVGEQNASELHVSAC